MNRLFLFFYAILLFSCDKKEEIIVEEKNEIELKVFPMFGSSNLILDSSYLTSENYKIQFTEIKFYISALKSNTKTFSEVALFDYRNMGNSFVKIEGVKDDFTNLNFYLGIDSLLNHSDPSAFASSSPLNIMNANDMHWGWNPGYIFLKIEAKVDTIPDNVTNLDHFVTFHIGKDNYKKNLNFPVLNWVQINKNLSQAKLKIDLQQFLNSPQVIHLNSEFVSHSSPDKEALSMKVINNFANALSFE